MKRRKLKKQIKSVLDTAADTNLITTEELKAMLTDDKNPAKFYQLFKVHKTHIPGDTPPSMPIISGSGSYTEDISLFSDNFLKPLSNLHPSYLQDTSPVHISSLNTPSVHISSLNTSPVHISSLNTSPVHIYCFNTSLVYT